MNKTIYINFFDGINPTTVNKFIQFTVDAINQHSPTEIYYKSGSIPRPLGRKLICL